MADLDAVTLARARAGDRDAFRAIVERHSRSVFRTAYRLTRSEPDAEDVVQETFLKAYTQLPLFQGRAALATWLHRIAVNCAVDLLRRRSAAREGTADEPALARLASTAPAPDREATGRELRAHVDHALAGLTPLERAAFTLRHLEERSIEDVCATLGQSPAAARHAVFRAVAKVRRALAPLVGAER